jgi:hypothetical protein
MRRFLVARIVGCSSIVGLGKRGKGTETATLGQLLLEHPLDYLRSIKTFASCD